MVEVMAGGFLQPHVKALGQAREPQLPQQRLQTFIHRSGSLLKGDRGKYIGRVRGSGVGLC